MLAKSVTDFLEKGKCNDGEFHQNRSSESSTFFLASRNFHPYSPHNGYQVFSWGKAAGAWR
jgi:hypothetical protein